MKQKIKGGADSICPKCFHSKVCRARDNQPCVECNQFVDANGVTIQRWISVTERLPEEKGDVLVCDTREDFVASCEYLGHGLWLYDNIFWGTDDFTHWMPLPEAPEGQ